MRNKAVLERVRNALIAAGCTLPELGSAGEREATRRWNGALQPRPALVARCATTAQVSATLRAAADSALPVSVHNGGQDWNGRSLRDDALVIDLSLMNQVSANAMGPDATIGGGVTVGQINEALRGSGLQAVIGNDGAVGMAGFMLGGGYGPLMNRFGMACDNLLSAEVVLPHGNVVNCDAAENPELFWALRGGGGNFGVVTSARIRLHAVSTVAVSNIVFTWPDAHAALRRYAELMLYAPAELFGAAILTLGPGGKPVLVISLVGADDVAFLETCSAAVTSGAIPIVVDTKAVLATELLSSTDGKLAQGNAYEVATRWFDRLDAVIDALIEAFDQRTSPLTSIVIHHCHGVAAEVPAEATAFGMRRPHFTTLIYGAWRPGQSDEEQHRNWVHTLDARLAKSALPGGYANVLSDDAISQIANAYAGNEMRLNQVKQQIDPNGTFRAIPLPRFGAV
jgi:FAD/FMN-containing dehydrogenase